MVLGKAGGALVVGDVVKTDGTGIVDQSAEQTMALGQVSDQFDLFRRHTHVNELFKTTTGRDYAKGPVLSTNQIDRDLHDPSKNYGEV